jgi:alpha-tubulin suppressor-like RCC1 family protein
MRKLTIILSLWALGMTSEGFTTRSIHADALSAETIPAALKVGDAVRVKSGSYFVTLTVKQVLIAEYRVWYLMSDGHIYGYSNNGGTYIKKWQEPSGHPWKVATVGFNLLNCIDTFGYVWQSKVYFLDNKDSFFRVDTDTTGAAFSGNWYVTYFAFANMTLAADSTPYYFGQDNYSFFYAGGNLDPWTGANMKPTQFSTLKLRKIVMGYQHIVGLSSDGLTVYEWLPGNRTPHQSIPLPRPATDIFVAASNFWGYLMPDATGSQTMGYPYVAGSSTSLYGGTGGGNTTPASIKSLWGLTQPIKKFDVDWQAIHFIDSSGHLWGCGWNSFGEVGNGVEFVGRHTYQGGNFSYGWPLTNGENPSGIPVKIGDTTKTDWVNLYSTNWFGTTKYAIDSRDTIYSWGRNKANVMGNGIQNRTWLFDNSNMDQYHYNAVDIITPTVVTPLTAATTLVDGLPPTVGAANQTITTSSTSITCTGNMLQVTKVSGGALVCCNITSHAWTKLSGPNTPTLTNANTATVNISGMVNGTYVFQDFVSDNNSGQDTVQAQIVVNIAPTNQRVQYNFHKNISRKI